MLNGLIAYGLFQHWGNGPDRFSTTGSPEATFLDACWTATEAPDWSALQPLVGLPDTVANAVGDLRVLDDTSIRFDVTIGPGDGWPTTIVLLDERTTRRLDPALDAAGRISTTAVDQMLPSPGAPSPQPVIIVAPAPVFGLNLLENQAQPLLSLLPGGAEDFDYEPWAAHTESFEHLVSRLAEFGRAVVLSGDLHIGFTMAVDHREPAAAVPSRLAQLVSSGSKRSDPKTVALHLFGDTMRRLGMVRTRSYRGYAQLSSAQRAPFVSPPPGEPSIQYDNLADILLGRAFREAQQAPAVFSDDVAAAYNLPSGDWEYRITPVDDNSVPTITDDPVLRSAIEAAGEIAPWTGWDPDKSYPIVRGLQASDRLRIGHVFSGLSQASKVTFDATDSVTVNHRIVISAGESDAPGSTATTNTSVVLDP